jgi:hypothetical protein
MPIMLNDFFNKENCMMSTFGTIINLGLVVYLGVQARACLEPDMLSNTDVAKNPLLLSFVAIVALFIAVKNR